MELEVMMRIKLPVDGGFVRDSMGDFTPDQQKCADAIFAAKPVGFEVRWPEIGTRWPMDSDGVTYVPLYVSHSKDAYAGLLDRYERLRQKVTKLQLLAAEIVSTARA
jgi:hypothetical protein